MILISVLTFLVVVACVWLYLSAPSLRRKNDSAYKQKFYAHRGLHGADDAPENSLGAFRRAVEAGYGIELDVQMTSDGHLVVFHDMQLRRMCGVDGILTDSTLAHLKTLRLLNSNQEIPTFDEVLALVDGKVPLLVEVKLNTVDTHLTPAVIERLNRYTGPYIVESFVPTSMHVFKKRAPNVTRGQLVSRFHWKSKSAPIALSLLLSNLCLNFLSRPDFIAYDKTMDKTFILFMMRRFFKVKTAVWTIRTREEYKLIENTADIVIFENFIP